MADSRWDWLEGVRAQSIEDAIAAEMGKRIASELRAWPPDLEWQDASAAARFKSLCERREIPSDRSLRDGFRLARWDLAREWEAIDFYRRNEPADAAVDLIHLYLVETMMTLGEKTDGRIKRSHMIAALDLAERLLAAA